MNSNTGNVMKKKTKQSHCLVLSGDIGGTSSRLQLSLYENNQYSVLKLESFKNKQYTFFREIVAEFLENHDVTSIDLACFAFAGPVLDGKVSLTNLPWAFVESELEKVLGIKHVVFLNDFTANAHGISLLNEDDYIVLQEGKPDPAAVASIVGAGTGLGVSFLQYIKEELYVLTTEGGHSDFSPTTDLQMSLLNHLKKKLKRVSVERVVSGMGIVNIYNFLITLPEYSKFQNKTLTNLSKTSSNFAADITTYALDHNDIVANVAMDIFLRSYGSFAGDIALTTLPYRGLYIAGGIAPKLTPLIRDGRFLQAFLNKGRMSYLLHNVPIYMITNTNVGLLGAAHYAVTKFASI